MNDNYINIFGEVMKNVIDITQDFLNDPDIKEILKLNKIESMLADPNNELYKAIEAECYDHMYYWSKKYKEEAAADEKEA